MISFLRGRLEEAEQDFVILDVGGVGYRLHVPCSTRRSLPPVGENTRFYTYLQVREDALTLYGFASREEHRLFELLLGVSGVGPRLALGVLSAASPEVFCRLVAYEDIAGLSRLPGIGRKTAQRMILELKDKLAPMAVKEKAQPGGKDATHREALEALEALGYTRSEAVQALGMLAPGAGTGAGVEELVRAALRHLGGRQAAGSP